MTLLLLVACVHLKEGDYAVDYEPVSLDSCDLFDGGQAAEDTTGELAWEDDTLVLEMDGTDDDLEFAVDGRSLSRETQGTVPLDDDCSLVSAQTDEGEMRSDTRFSGETKVVANLAGSCEVWQAIYDPPCRVQFSWTGEFSD